MDDDDDEPWIFMNKLLKRNSMYNTNINKNKRNYNNVPLVLYKSAALVCNKPLINELKSATSNNPSMVKPTEETRDKLWVFLTFFFGAGGLSSI